MKKILTVVLLLTVLCETALTQSANDFVVDANGVITRYIGFDTDIVIPATIGDLAFSFNKLTSVNIPNSVKEIGYLAFMNNPIANIIIPEGVETIGEGAFAGTNCTSVSLPSTVRYIISDAFDTSAKPSFTLTANINIEFSHDSVFYNYIANDRKAGTYAFDLPNVLKNTDGYEYYETQYGAVLIRYTENSKRVRIPAEIGGITVKALYGTYNHDYSREYNSYYIYDTDHYRGIFSGRDLTAVQIPEGIIYVGKYTFPNNQLASVILPNSVTYIGDGAFQDNQLTSFTIPNGVTYIGDKAFQKNQLTSVTIPNSVTYIDGSAFDSNPLTSVTFQGTITSANFVSGNRYPSYDLRDKYLAGGRGTYRRDTSSTKWTKQ